MSINLYEKFIFEDEDIGAELPDGGDNFDTEGNETPSNTMEEGYNDNAGVTSYNSEYVPKTDYKINIERINLDSQGYTPSGEYFGVGKPLYYFTANSVPDEKTIQGGYIRAHDAKEARFLVKQQHHRDIIRMMNPVLRYNPKYLFSKESTKINPKILIEKALARGLSREQIKEILVALDKKSPRLTETNILSFIKLYNAKNNRIYEPNTIRALTDPSSGKELTYDQAKEIMLSKGLNLDTDMNLQKLVKTYTANAAVQNQANIGKNVYGQSVIK